MSVETNNAPGRVWLAVGPEVKSVDWPRRSLLRVYGVADMPEKLDEFRAEYDGSEENRPNWPIHEFVRRDLVVPTVDEIAGAVCNGLHGVGVQLDEATEHERGVIDNVSRAVRSLLLSRIEGNNEPTGDCETDCTERCRGECGDLAGGADHAA